MKHLKKFQDESPQVSGSSNLDQDDEVHSDQIAIQYTNARVLVVEDNPVNQMVAESMLEKLGIQVELAANGEEALHCLEQSSYDLVFMDCQMPVMDGYEATRKIRNHKSKVQDRNIAIIAMTGNSRSEDKDRCVEAGMSDYIAKPIDLTTLNKFLQHWLPEHCIKNTKQETKIEPEITNESAIIIQKVFDYDAFSQRLMDDKKLMSAIVTVFLKDIPIQIQKLKAAIEAENFQEVTSQAHKIKGAAANVGGMLFSSQAHAMENFAKAGELESLRRVLPELEKNFFRLKTTIEIQLL